MALRVVVGGAEIGTPWGGVKNFEPRTLNPADRRLSFFLPPKAALPDATVRGRKPHTRPTGKGRLGRHPQIRSRSSLPLPLVKFFFMLFLKH
jgi:hypothetical protein